MWYTFTSDAFSRFRVGRFCRLRRFRRKARRSVEGMPKPGRLRTRFKAKQLRPAHFLLQYRWLEVNCTYQEPGHIPIWEPCNYASNVAYYHTAVEVCKRQEWDVGEEYGADSNVVSNYSPKIQFLYLFQVTAMVQTFSLLAVGSAFFHGSNTTVGGVADVKLNDLFAYVAYQAAISDLVMRPMF